MVAKSATPSDSTRSASGTNARPAWLTMKPGVSLQRTGVWPKRLRERGERVARPRLGEHAVDHFDDLHHRHRVEEVVAGDAARPLAGRGHRGHRQRGGIGGEDAVGGHRLFPARRKELALGREVLDDRLDHHVAGREAFHATRRSRCAAGSSPRRAAPRRPFSTSLPRLWAIESFALRAAPGWASNTRVRAPHCASTCAMPRPMVPVPATPATRSLRLGSSKPLF